MIILSFVGKAFPQQHFKQDLEELKTMQLRFDESDDSIYLFIQDRIQTEKEPELQALWHVYMAKFLQGHWQSHRYEIANRTPVAGARPADFKTWDGSAFHAEIVSQYDLALQNKSRLQACPIEQYKVLLEAVSEEACKRRPTLFDAIAHDALECYASLARMSTLPQQPFQMDKEGYFADNEEFVNFEIATTDSSSLQWLSLKLLQEVTAFHLKNRHELPLADITLKRLEYVKEQTTLQKPFLLYEKALLSLFHDFENKKGFAEICYELGEFYAYNVSDMDDADKIDHVKAVSYFEKAASDTSSFVSENARARIRQIQQQKIQIIMPNELLPQEQLFAYQYRNCDTLYTRIVPMSKKEYEKCMTYYYAKELPKKLKECMKMKAVAEWALPVKNEHDYQEYTADAIWPKLEPGGYVILVASSPFKFADLKFVAWNWVQVTDIAAISRNAELEYLLINRTTGAPLQNTKLSLRYEGYRQNAKNVTAKTDKNGIVKIEKLKNFNNVSITVKSGKDEKEFSTYYYNYENSNQPQIQDYIFTDRAIYRPGQKVYFKLLSLTSSERRHEVRCDKNITVELRDANHQVVQKMVLKTNEFGTANGSFEIPLGGLTGSYTLQSHHGSHGISVEEYKRPQFEVEVQQPADAYRLGDTVHINGTAKAYAGYPIDGAKVHYRVMRTPHYRYWFYQSEPAQEILFADTETDAEGVFTFDFVAEAGKADFYNYKVTVEVVDINGETHEASANVHAGRYAMTLALDIPELLEPEQMANGFSLLAQNLNGTPQTAEVNYTIWHLEMPKNFLHQRPYELPTATLLDSAVLKNAFPYIDLWNENEKSHWKTMAQMGAGKLLTNEKSLLKIADYEKYTEGAYKIVLTTQDVYGEKVTLEKYFTVQKNSSKKSVCYAPVMLRADRTTAKVGDKVRVYLSSYLPEANVYFEIISNDTVLDAEWLTLKQGQTYCDLTIEEAYRGTLTFSAFVGDCGFEYQDVLKINVPFDNKKLQMEWVTFRNKMEPGSEEEWQLKIKGPQGEWVAAEVLCSMYDASLDAFVANNWHFDLDFLHLTKRLQPFVVGDAFPYNHYARSYSFEKIAQLKHFSYYDLINVFYYSGRNRLYAVSKSSGAMFNDASETISVRGNRADVEMEADFDFEEVTLSLASEEPMAQDERALEEPEPVQVRSDFAETAFFFPELGTDDEGNVLLKFKMPESLTRWKLQGLAHTKTLENVLWTDELETVKDVMVVPNVPRFVREGDVFSFAAKVVNLSANKLYATVHIEFIDALTQKPINILQTADNQNITIDANGSQKVNFEVNIPQGLSALTYRIVVTTTDKGQMHHADGEEATLPVLPNRMLVTETLNLYVNGNKSKTFEFPQLDKHFHTPNDTRQTYALKLEMTPNPMWYAVQALPYLMEYPYECNEQIFSRIYANTLAMAIANSSPEIKKTFEGWKNLNPDELASNLQKNEDLKSVMLEETPWVREAQSEASAKQNLALLFDVKKIEKENKKWCSKLEKNQNADGSWAWFGKDERFGSTYITTHIVSQCGHLQVLGVKNPDNLFSAKTLKKAITYLDKEQEKSYLDRKKDKMLDAPLSYADMHYLYTRSFFLKRHELSGQHQTIYNYYLEKAKKEWKSESYYMQGLLALALFRSGDVTTAKAIVKNLKSFAQYSEEMGMWWKKEGYGWFWYEAPVERQAMLIEAFLTIANDVESAEKMQQWLLKQKQTQNWETTRGTAEACYALFLNKGLATKEMGSDARPLQVRIGEKQLEVEDNPTVPTVMQNIAEEEAKSDNKFEITLTKPSSGIAWGGLYWQYFDDLDHIEATQTANGQTIPLHITKQLYKVILDERGEKLQAVTPQQPLTVGDKVRVRVELRADRDFEYVHLKDMRAATFEPTEVFSRYVWRNGLYYYQSVRDASVNFFFDYLAKGTYVFEYTLIATQAGVFSNGISTVQCMYAPQFASHSAGTSVRVLMNEEE